MLRSLVLTVLVFAGCGNRDVLLPAQNRASPAIREACKVAEIRCSSCHTLERIVSSQRRGRADWMAQVTRMRLLPASGISIADADVIVDCLVYIDETRFGPDHTQTP